MLCPLRSRSAPQLLRLATTLRAVQPPQTPPQHCRYGPSPARFARSAAFVASLIGGFIVSDSPREARHFILSGTLTFSRFSFILPGLRWRLLHYRHRTFATSRVFLRARDAALCWLCACFGSERTASVLRHLNTRFHIDRSALAQEPAAGRLPTAPHLRATSDFFCTSGDLACEPDLIAASFHVVPLTLHCVAWTPPAEALGLGYVPHSRAALCSAPHTHAAGRVRVLVVALTSRARAIPACATLSGWVTLAAPCNGPRVLLRARGTMDAFVFRLGRATTPNMDTNACYTVPRVSTRFVCTTALAISLPLTEISFDAPRPRPSTSAPHVLIVVVPSAPLGNFGHLTVTVLHA
ncbi:hypothetical protein B0H14DRAFT_3421919 [Mycena olivaceomarginata]|nr:hypothetical protein B0H14DRAFT_3421919 [Mycena olivaceomarginata]